ncbi:hypothetical protein FPZ43_05785 [Mucilaginibacter pallidiroseus]|uniref:Uncharacterized protein n=1 Tax=Mucilaginibacter pallidiroseus TaxID=2599295 RepID=A0A563UGH9_9SPHI|nr:hypothetical protein [Mucilaginibacter pallidiroseus]TWR30451.1 hypothetical protein FPZ43_05785 [Mucilaginibacter pallidiroseus]
MRKFITTLFAFAVALTAVVFICNRNYFPAKAKGNDGYMGAMVDKHHFADSHQSPRIIFCGGSNIAFGINSKRIQDSTGLPTVNLGTTGSLGLDFILNEARRTARLKDIIIISSEYYLSNDGSYAAKKEALRIYPPAGKYFKQTPQQWLHDFFVEDLQRNLTVTLSTLLHVQRKGFPTNVVYSRSSFNENGDVVRSFDPHPSHEFLKTFDLKYKLNPNIQLLNDFKDYADKNGMAVYFIYPSFPQSLYNANAKVIDAYERDMQSGIKIKILNHPKDALFADSLFYDTEYHLVPQGRELRTDKIIELLRKEKIARR